MLQTVKDLHLIANSTKKTHLKYADTEKFDCVFEKYWKGFDNFIIYSS